MLAEMVKNKVAEDVQLPNNAAVHQAAPVDTDGVSAGSQTLVPQGVADQSMMVVEKPLGPAPVENPATDGTAMEEETVNPAVNPANAETAASARKATEDEACHNELADKAAAGHLTNNAAVHQAAPVDTDGVSAGSQTLAPQGGVADQSMMVVEKPLGPAPVENPLPDDWVDPLTQSLLEQEKKRCDRIRILANEIIGRCKAEDHQIKGRANEIIGLL